MASENYKLMIVDDEQEVREGIARKIHWDELGFELVAVAENGEDALEKAENCYVDLLLTDIKMPFMDGLTLCAKLKQIYPNVRTLILTGFDEFEFAKQAISLNVVEYILKPVNEQELNEILRRVKRVLDEDIERKRNISVMRENYERSLPLLREHFINELLWGLIPREDIEQRIKEYSLPFVKGRQKNVTVYDIDQKSAKQSSLEPELVPISVKQLVDLHCEGKCSFETYISSKTIVAITEWSSDDPIDEVMGLANEICDECRRVFDFKVTAGVGRCCDSVSRLPASYSDAVAACEYKSVAGSGSVIYIRDMEILELEPQSISGTREKNLVSAIKFGSRELIESAVADILSADAETDEWQYMSSLIAAFNCIANLIQRTGADETEILGQRAVNFFAKAESLPPDELKSWLVDVCARLNAGMYERRVSTEEKIISDAKGYIEKNYSNAELSVDTLCDFLHISQSYFSTLFKKVTGQPYIRYLTEVRMNKALELLQTTEEKTYLIANSVGYEEPNYFSHVFKKQFGMSPTQYRQSLTNMR